MSDPRPIGVFDSGLGGLTVVRAIMDDLPAEPIAYVGDTARFPYGPRPAEEIRRFAVQIARHLLTLDVKLIVVACNSATSAALDQVTAAVPVPVVGVIEPAVRAAVRATRNRRVGLIGTEVTVSSGAYQRSFAESAPDVEVTARPCPRFVEFVERGDTTSVELLDEYTLRVRLKESFSPFLTSWGDTYIVPAHILEGVADPNTGVQYEKPGGHGPLQVREPGGRRSPRALGRTP